MRYFKCFDCGYIWAIVFWEESEGTKMACPKCKSLNVYQIEKVRGWDRAGKYTSLVNDEHHKLIAPGSEIVKKGLQKGNAK